MIFYLKKDIIPDDRKIRKYIQDEKDYFKIGRDITTDKL